MDDEVVPAVEGSHETPIVLPRLAGVRDDALRRGGKEGPGQHRRGNTTGKEDTLPLAS